LVGLSPTPRRDNDYIRPGNLGNVAAVESDITDQRSGMPQVQRFAVSNVGQYIYQHNFAGVAGKKKRNRKVDSDAPCASNNRNFHFKPQKVDLPPHYTSGKSSLAADMPVREKNPRVSPGIDEYISKPETTE
jgi:hypothetical protein